MGLYLRSDEEYIDPSEVQLWVSEMMLAQFVQVGIATALAYDTSMYNIRCYRCLTPHGHKVITMDKEVLTFSPTNLNLIIMSSPGQILLGTLFRLSVSHTMLTCQNIEEGPLEKSECRLFRSEYTLSLSVSSVI